MHGGALDAQRLFDARLRVRHGAQRGLRDLCAKRSLDLPPRTRRPAIKGGRMGKLWGVRGLGTVFSGPSTGTLLCRRLLRAPHSSKGLTIS